MAPPDALKLLLVRHGQSTNNILLDRLDAERAVGEMTPQEYRRTWMRERSDDPPLSSKGVVEAEQLGIFYGNKLRNKPVRLFCSAMYRACQTIAPLARELGNQPVTVRPDIHETGGIFASDGREPIPSPVAGKTHTAMQLAELFPTYDVSLLPQTGMWTTAGYEDIDQVNSRVLAVTNWLTSEQLRHDIGDAQMVLVSHAVFLDKLLQKLLRTADGAASFAFANTSTARLDIHQNGACTVRWLVRVDHLLPFEGAAVSKL
eukprot:TRINITY_DN43692_c0_g1_i1.p1 TRINITY_DN43692_c0_g1~~TRINITY_DN43692_c0_g1_i1.p1  ORF type:complete len:281 (-),score=22.53 TRINITY_DN43692_c0_g1_i1:89-868(-)